MSRWARVQSADQRHGAWRLPRRQSPSPWVDKGAYSVEGISQVSREYGPLVPIWAPPGSAPGAPLSSEDGTRTGRPGPFVVFGTSRRSPWPRTSTSATAEAERRTRRPGAGRGGRPRRLIEHAPAATAGRRRSGFRARADDAFPHDGRRPSARRETGSVTVGRGRTPASIRRIRRPARRRGAVAAAPSRRPPGARPRPGPGRRPRGGPPRLVLP